MKGNIYDSHLSGMKKLTGVVNSIVALLFTVVMLRLFDVIDDFYLGMLELNIGGNIPVLLLNTLYTTFMAWFIFNLFNWFNSDNHKIKLMIYFLTSMSTICVVMDNTNALVTL